MLFSFEICTFFRPLVGETVDLIKTVVASQNWKSAFIYTTVSTSAHFHLHGSVSVSEAAFFRQFSDALLEISSSLAQCATKSAPSLRHLSFSNNSFSNDCFELVQSQIRPLFQSQIRRIGSPRVPGFSFHNLAQQDRVEILSFAAALAEMQRGVEMSFWAAGEISKIVAERLLAANSKSDLNRQAVLLFDRHVEFGKEQGGNFGKKFQFCRPIPDPTPIFVGGRDFPSLRFFRFPNFPFPRISFFPIFPILLIPDFGDSPILPKICRRRPENVDFADPKLPP